MYLDYFRLANDDLECVCARFSRAAITNNFAVFISLDSFSALVRHTQKRAADLCDFSVSASEANGNPKYAIFLSDKLPFRFCEARRDEKSLTSQQLYDLSREI